MGTDFHPHSLDRIEERGTTQAEVMATVEEGETFPAKFGRTGFRRDFPFGQNWKGKWYKTKQVEVYAAREGEGWLVITVLVKFY